MSIEKFSRRRLLQGSMAVGTAALAAGAGLLPYRSALAGDRLLIVQWGAKWIEVSKEIIAAYQTEHDDQIAWELHSGGAAAVIAKIKATWPNTQYNIVSAWTPVFRSMITEDWIVPVSEAEVPNLKDIPAAYNQKNDQGQLMTVPLSTAGAFWGFRDDLIEEPITSIEQILEPRFKGKVVVPYPVNLTGLLIVSLAIQRGGDEFNVEPGWEFLKELAKSGNIGQICNNNSEFINAMATGQHSVGFWNNGGWFVTKQRFPVTILSRLPDNKGFLYNEGFVVLKDSPTEAAFRVANYFASPEMNTKYNWDLGSGPTNVNSKANPQIADIYYSTDELEQHAYFADFTHLGQQLNDWTKRWETEVVPLIRG